MNVWALIGQSYALPFQRFGAMTRVFWLPALIWIFIAVVSEYYFRSIIDTSVVEKTLTSDGQTPQFSKDLQKQAVYFVGYYGALILLFLFYTTASASGLVRWHRYLIKDHAPEAARSWLMSGEWRFLWRWCWLGFVFVLLGALAFLLVIAAGYFAMGPEKMEQMFEPEASSASIGFGLAWTFVLAMGMTGWFFPRTFLSLAALAVGEGDEYRKVAKSTISAGDCSALTLAILTTTAPFLMISIGLPSMLAPSNSEHVMPDFTPLYVVITAIANILSFLSMVVFATMLSLFYRQRVRLNVDTVAETNA